MGNLHIVTGYKGENHVTAADIASFQASIFGTGEYVLNRGNKFSTTVVSNNQIRVADGDILMQGRHIRMNEGTYVDLTIENGSQGYFRNDLIVARYTKDSTTGVEDCNLVVIKGTAVSADPVDPEYTTGDIIEEHVLLNDMPLYRIPLDGLNVGTLVPLWTEASITADVETGAITGDKIASGAVTKYFSAQIGTNWQGTEAPFTQEITISGVLASDRPVVDIIHSEDFETVEAETEAWSKIYRITTGQNKITVYAKEKPETAVSIQMGVTRK